MVNTPVKTAFLGIPNSSLHCMKHTFLTVTLQSMVLVIQSLSTYYMQQTWCWSHKKLSSIFSVFIVYYWRMKDVSMRYNKSTEMVMEVQERQLKNLGYTRYYFKKWGEPREPTNSNNRKHMNVKDLCIFVGTEGMGNLSASSEILLSS